VAPTNDQIRERLSAIDSPRGGKLTDSGVLSDIVVTDGKVFFSLSVDAADVKAWEPVRKQVEEGKTMAEPLAACGVFPPMVVQMIAVGEATGAMDAMLNKIADFYDDEVDDAVGAMTAMMEPLLMVFLGTTVGGLPAMCLPIFRLAGAAGGWFWVEQRLKLFIYSRI
jgi:hypothetical protein